MMKAIFIFLMVFSVSLYSQDTKPTLKKVGKLVEATYFHDNGNIAQTGFLLKGKLHGQWLMYNTTGKKIASGKYEEGKKVGKWFFWEGEILKEVDYAENRVVNVKKWNKSEVVSVNL